MRSHSDFAEVLHVALEEMMLSFHRMRNGIHSLIDSLVMCLIMKSTEICSWATT